MTSFPPIPKPPPIDTSKKCRTLTQEEFNFIGSLHGLKNDVAKTNSTNIQNDEYVKYLLKSENNENNRTQVISYIDEVYNRPFEKYIEKIDEILKTFDIPHCPHDEKCQQCIHLKQRIETLTQGLIEHQEHFKQHPNEYQMLQKEITKLKTQLNSIQEDCNKFC